MKGAASRALLSCLTKVHVPGPDHATLLHGFAPLLKGDWHRAAEDGGIAFAVQAGDL